MRSMDMADLQRMAGDWIEPDPAPVPIQSTNHSHHHGNGSTFDIVDFLRHNNVDYKDSPHNGGTKYVLAECPFDRAHKSPDAAVFVGADGKLGFRCLHNSCAGYHWHDFRAFYEPRKNEIVKHQPPAATPSSAAPVHAAPRSIRTLMGVHTALREPIIHGLLRRGETMNIIAPPKTGKSWLVNQLALKAVCGGYWHGHLVERGNVLILDNELHAENKCGPYPARGGGYGYERR